MTTITIHPNAEIVEQSTGRTRTVYYYPMHVQAERDAESGCYIFEHPTNARRFYVAEGYTVEAE